MFERGIHKRESAHHHLSVRVPTAGPDESAGSVLERLRTEEFDTYENVHVTDTERRLQGVVRLQSLLVADPTRPMRELATAAPVVHPETDQEVVATQAIRHQLASVPIVDHEGRFMGVVSAHSILRILRQEHIEDVHRLAGIRRETAKAADAVDALPSRRVWDRLPWLVVGLGGSALATLIMADYEHELQSKVAVAYFVPAIVYLADAVGTQSEAVAVRGLSLSHLPVGKIIFRELMTGFIIGVLLAVPVFAMVAGFMGDVRLAGAVALSLVVAGSIATTIGMGLPLLLARIGRDPAYGSGPLATIIQDVLSLLVYFLIVKCIVF